MEVAVGKLSENDNVKCSAKEWPLFSAPGLSSMRVIGYKEKAGTWHFTVLSILEGFRWKIDKTYEEFVDLQKILTKGYGMKHPVLSSYKKLLGFGMLMGMRETDAAEARNKLETFLMSAVINFPIPPMELLQFVEYPFTDVLSITQTLAKLFYVEGEIVLAHNTAIQMSPLQLHCINKRMMLPLGSCESGKMKDDFGHLLDFLQNLRKLKIATSFDEFTAIVDVEDLTFDLGQMKSLEVLLLESIRIQQLEGRHCLPGQLIKLEVRRSLKLLQDVLLVYPLSDLEHTPASPDPTSFQLSANTVNLSQAMKWEKLYQANFKLNNISMIDNSVELLVAVEILDLSFNYIEEIKHLVNLPNLRVLDLSHNKISCLKELNTKLGNITKLSLACNNIVKLKGIEKMFSVQYLDLSNNHISEVSEVGSLNMLPYLSELQLKGNPIACYLSYRSQVFNQIQNYVEQVALDGKLPSRDELMVSTGTPTSGHKRVPSRTPDIKPDDGVTGRHEVLEEMESGMGVTNRLEELRKKEGEDWLSILNRKQGQDDEMLVSKSPSKTKKKKGKHHRHKAKGRKTQLEESPEQKVTEESYSATLFKLVEAMQEGKPVNNVNFDVTVLQYRSTSFLSLSVFDLDQLLLNTAMEECTLSVDTHMGKALEIDTTANTTRITRDLRLIHNVKVHEGKRLAVCLQLPSSRGNSLPGSRWIIYCVRQLDDLANLYSTVRLAKARSRSGTPDCPFHEFSSSIKSDMEDSLTSPFFPLTRSQSDSDSLPSCNPTTFNLPHVTSHLTSDKNELEESTSSIGVFSPLISVTTVDGGVSLDANFEKFSTGDLFPSNKSGSTQNDNVERRPLDTPSASFSKLSPLENAPSQAGTLTPKKHHESPPRSPEVLSPPGKKSSSPSSQRNVEACTTSAACTSNDSSTSKPSSNSSSKANSGRNTPRDQKTLGNSPTLPSGREESLKNSPAPHDSPSLTVARKPPQDFPKEFVKRKLEDLVSTDGAELSLPSPLYSQELAEKWTSTAEGGEGTDGEDNRSKKVRSIYDRQEYVEMKKNVVEAAVMMSDPEKSGSHIGRRRDRRNPPAKISLSSTIMVTKPGLDSNSIHMFFKKVIADENSEILMNITWGIANLPSVPSCELEVGVLISDRGVYLLEVLDPKNHPQTLSWMSENLPLANIMFCIHNTIRKVNIGIFDQSLTLEAWDKGGTKIFVLFPHTFEKLNLFVENLKAAFDASSLPYTIASNKDSFVNLDGKDEMVVRNPGSSDMAALKDSLVLSRSQAQVGNFIAVNSKSETSPLAISVESELNRVSLGLASKFEIVQYVIVGEMTSDVLPLSNGGVHVCSRALILTNKMIYLCKEELYSWPHTCKSIRPPPFPKCMVIDAHPLSRISGIKMCDKSRPFISCSNPFYEFSISFEQLDDIRLSPTLVREWVLCAHDRQYLDQLLGCLMHLSNEHQKENQKLVSIKHVASKLFTPASPNIPKAFQHLEHRKACTVSEAGSKRKTICSNRGDTSCFFSSKGLLEFSHCTNYQRLKFFKKHVTQADFLKSDEIPLSVFLSHCSFSMNDYVEIEVCVIVSNYALYLLSDVDNIQYWLESGGVFSYQRRDLLDRTDSILVRSFYHLWLNEIKQVSVGLYYTSLSITDIKEPNCPRFVMHTENPSATLSFLNALSCIVDLHDSEVEKEMDCLLSDYDLMDDGIDGKADKKKQADRSSKAEKHKVEFVCKSEDNLGKLKGEMVYMSPAITKGMSFEVCNASMMILYQQVVLLVEELRIRDHLSYSFCPHFVFLTNYGMYVCLNKVSEKCSPAVLDPSKLSVKKWCHIDLLERLQVIPPTTQQYSYYNIVVHLRSSSRASLSSGDSNTLSFLVQNSELLNCFLYHFSLMYHERCGKQISILM